MKKVLVLLSMFALASGAWAEDDYYGYTWSISINNLPDVYNIYGIFPDDLTAYLIDTSKTDDFGRYKTLAYVSTDDILWDIASDGSKKIKGASAKSAVLVDRGDLPKEVDRFYMDNSMKIESVTMKVSKDPRHEGKEADQFSVVYGSSENLIGYYDNPAALKTVLFSKISGRYQILDVSWSTEQAFGSSAGFNPVPEPTSGLLLLLGVAGLALKRKKAA